MDVPFSSSGAMSRAHYALVRKIESAAPQAGDQLLLAEVHSIRKQLTRSTLTLKQCKEFLVLLLYCFMAVNPGINIDLQFALPHAINLAEAGQTTQDKRAGYLFCAEVMPPEHELQLMLVNSIRKDLESPAVPRICLALDTLIQSPSKDVIPAVQTRLQDLLSHYSMHVRRRALLAFKVLSKQDPDILRDTVSKLQRRLTDPEAVVAGAALTLINTMLKAHRLPIDKYHTVVTKLLDVLWSQRPESPQTLVKTLEVISQLTPSPHDLTVIIEILRHYAHIVSPSYSVISQSFSTISTAPVETVAELQASSGIFIVQEIRHLLISHDINACYVFIRGISCIDPKLWAGTTPEIPTVLEEWEVERVMKLLHSEDKLIRKETLRTLWHVDQTVVESYYARALQGDLPPFSAQGTMNNVARLLEILDIICGDDGEAYAHQLKNVLKAEEGDGPLKKRVVLQEAVEEMLTRTHAADSDWRSGSIGVLFSSIIDKHNEVGPTLTVIISALLCEYLELSPISPVELLRGLSERLSSYSSSIQDVCLITMLRVSVAVGEVPVDVVEIVKNLQSQGSRHIRRRCDQFSSVSQSRDDLRRIIALTHTPSLPDFVVALEKYDIDRRRAVSRSPSLQPSSPPLKPHTPEPLSSRKSPSPGKLRYTAYEAPKPARRMQRTSSASSRNSEDGSVYAWSSYQDTMARTVTPGDLTLAAQASDLRISSRSPPRSGMSPLPTVQILDEEPEFAAADLITLDSPFIGEPVESSISSTMSSISENDFETTWDALQTGAARGWCEASMDTLLRRLQGLQQRLRVTERDRSPFEGDLKVVILPEPDDSSKPGPAAIRLKESDDDSCLWWVRCEDERFRNIIKATLK